MQFYFAKPLAIDKNLPQNFTPKEIECAIVATATMKRTRFLPVTWPFRGEEDAPRMRHQRGNRVTEISAPGFARLDVRMAMLLCVVRQAHHEGRALIAGSQKQQR
jgi:hypothetical protein